MAAAASAHAPHPEPGDLMNMPTIGHLALFNQHLQKANTKVEWIYSDGDAVRRDGDVDMDMTPGDVLLKGTKATPVWYVKVTVDGEFYGRGRGNTKKAARNEAAKEGLKKMGVVVWFLLLFFLCVTSFSPAFILKSKWNAESKNETMLTASFHLP
jgi:ribonuclease-3